MNQNTPAHQEELPPSAITEAQMKAFSGQRLFSLHWEIKVLLYLGVLLLSTGLGILVYENIDTIGHQAVLAFIAILSAGSFFYCYKQSAPFSWNKVESPNPFFDYILLLGCLTFISFIGYLQFAYTVFGTKYGLATAIPLVALFFSAYYFDHLGVLSLAITNLAAWLGITVTPMRILSDNDFSSYRLIATGMGLGIFLLVLAIISQKKNLKAHFAFTYRNFGAHIFFISCLAAFFIGYNLPLTWFLVLSAFAAYMWITAYKEKSFYFLLITLLYEYLGLCTIVIRAFAEINEIYPSIMFVIVSAIFLCYYLIQLSKKIKHDRVQ